MYGDFRQPSRRTSLAGRRAALIVTLGSLAYPASMLRADEVYKSVDADGHVVYSDRIDASAARLPAVQIEGAQNPPRVLHICWTNCFTLSFDKGLYRRTDGSDETWTLELFTSRSVVMRRHDAPAAWNGFSADVTYRGQVSNDRLINVTVNGNPVPDINVAWGIALDTLPGSNAERDQRNSARLNTPVFPVSPSPSPAGIQSAVDGDMRTADAPPPLPNDEQPTYSAEGTLWTPGYWACGGAGFYWVPGIWVQPPRVGVLWTPGYWGFAGAVYLFHPGYWGPHVGFYGGINYGFGYAGIGYAGGRWVGNSFVYNRTVNNVGATPSRASYNGGPGGTTAAATAEERAAAAEPHIPPTQAQRQIVQRFAGSPVLMAQATGGHAAMPEYHRSTVPNAPRALGAHGIAAPPAHAGVAHAPPKPAGATPARPQHSKQ